MSSRNGARYKNVRGSVRNDRSLETLKMSLKQSLKDSKINNVVKRLLQGDGRVFFPSGPIPRSPALGEQIFHIRNSVIVLAGVTTSITVPTFFSRSFSLSDIDQSTDLVAVFDQYKIDSVECWIKPEFSSGTQLNNIGQYYSVIDFDDANALTTVGQALDYNNCVISSGQAGHYRRFRPSVAVGLYGGSAFSSFGNNTEQWIDAASPGVPHYGIKIAFSQTAATLNYDMTFTYHISFKSVR